MDLFGVISANISTFCGFQVEAPQQNQTYLDVKAQINIQNVRAEVICLQFAANGADPWFCVLVTSQKSGGGGFSGFHLFFFFEGGDTDL